MRYPAYTTNTATANKTKPRNSPPKLGLAFVPFATTRMIPNKTRARPSNTRRIVTSHLALFFHVRILPNPGGNVHKQTVHPPKDDDERKPLILKKLVIPGNHCLRYCSIRQECYGYGQCKRRGEQKKGAFSMLPLQSVVSRTVAHLQLSKQHGSLAEPPSSTATRPRPSATHVNLG